MGLFSQTDTYVSSVAYNIAGDAAERPQFIKQSLIFLNAAEQSIGEKLPRMYLQSLGIKLKRAFKHVSALPQGVPTSSMQLWEYQEFEDAVQTILNNEHGLGRYDVVDAYLVGNNAAPAIEKYLNYTYGWDAITGKMTKPPAGFAQTASLRWRHEPPQTVLGDTSPRVTRSYVLEFRHNPATVQADLSLNVSVDAVDNFAHALLVALIAETVTSTRSDTTVARDFQTGDTNQITETPVTTVVGAKVTVTTTTVTISTNGTTTTIRTRIVDATTSERVPREFPLGVGKWPTLDALWANRDPAEQVFFPSIPFRLDNKDVLSEKFKDTENYKQVHKICSLMGVNAGALRDQINDNKSIKDIDYAFLVAGANMNTQSQAEMDYLFRFWDMCREKQTVYEIDQATWLAQNMLGRGKPKVNELVIEDPESKAGAYTVKISWNYINKIVVNGTVSDTPKIGEMAIVVGATRTDAISTSDSRWLFDSTVVSIRKQINPGQFEELQIVGAMHRNEVYKGKGVETLARKARTNPDEEEGFIIPLHMGIFNAMPLPKRTQLGQECIYLVFNCYKNVKRKWYATGMFKIVLAIVLIIITIVTWGSATPATAGAWGTYVGGMAAAIGVSYAFLNFVIQMAIAYLVAYLMGKWSAGFESLFGKKWAAVMQVVVAIVVSYYTGGMAMNGYLQTAVTILNVASQLFAAYAKGQTIVQQDAYNAFMAQAEEDQKLLDKLSSEFFGDNDLVSVDYLLNLQKTLREDTPDVFLSRTLIVGSDVVDMTLGMVSEMVSLETSPRLQGITA